MYKFYTNMIPSNAFHSYCLRYFSSLIPSPMAAVEVIVIAALRLYLKLGQVEVEEVVDLVVPCLGLCILEVVLFRDHACPRSQEEVYIQGVDHQDAWVVHHIREAVLFPVLACPRSQEEVHIQGVESEGGTYLAMGHVRGQMLLELDLLLQAQHSQVEVRRECPYLLLVVLWCLLSPVFSLYTYLHYHRCNCPYISSRCEYAGNKGLLSICQVIQ
jgi:hypothetical protein